MLRQFITTTVLIFASLHVAAQFHIDDSSAVQFHAGVGTTIVGTANRMQDITWVAPRVEWRATDRLRLEGGFAVAGSLMDSYKIYGYDNRSLAPRKHRMAAVYAAGTYRASERLWVWASASHIGGFATPWWSSTGESVPISITQLSGGLGYEFGNGTAIELHVTMLHDRYNTLGDMIPYGFMDPAMSLYDGMPAMFGF